MNHLIHSVCSDEIGKTPEEGKPNTKPHGHQRNEHCSTSMQMRVCAHIKIMRTVECNETLMCNTCTACVCAAFGMRYMKTSECQGRFINPKRPLERRIQKEQALSILARCRRNAALSNGLVKTSASILAESTCVTFMRLRSTCSRR